MKVFLIRPKLINLNYNITLSSVEKTFKSQIMYWTYYGTKIKTID